MKLKKQEYIFVYTHYIVLVYTTKDENHKMDNSCPTSVTKYITIQNIGVSKIFFLRN